MCLLENLIWIQEFLFKYNYEYFDKHYIIVFLELINCSSSGIGTTKKVHSDEQ